MAAALLTAGFAQAAPLPQTYFRLLESGTQKVQARLDQDSNISLEKIEKAEGWRHFPYAILAPAVLYSKAHPQNPHHRDREMLDLAIRIGDLLAAEDEAGTFEPRGDSDWDTYIWMEAWKLLSDELGATRKERWKKAIERNVALVWHDADERVDFPWYNSPYIGTSPNHYAQYAGNLLLAGQLFGREDWVRLGTEILHRFSTIEQTDDGYWGEHSRRGPTTGYNLLTLTSVALYWELTKDPDALKALRRSTDFHKFFTFPDGTPVDVINDRNRHWGVSAWGQFAFSHFPDGRGYAEFLVDFFRPETLSMDELGRLAQDALYYHEGPVETPPSLQPRYSHPMSVPAGIRKEGPWVVAFSGIVDTQAVNSRFYLDRQGNLSVFHEKLGMIVTGANSKRQPELATFSERVSGEVIHLPLSSRLQMADSGDRLSLAFNTFWIDLLAPPPKVDEADFRFVITGRGQPSDETLFNLQLALKAGEPLETGTGLKITLGREAIEISPEQLGGVVRHHGWELRVNPSASLSWPVYPHNPYADAPETSLNWAVGRLTVPLDGKPTSSRYIRPAEQEIRVKIRASDKAPMGP